MATVLSTLYPPLIDTFMPAFPNTQSAEVHFTVSPYNSSYDIHYLHITLVDQRTNKNAFATDANIETPAGTALINGVWIIPFNDLLEGNINPYLDLNREANNYTLYIPPSILKQNEVNERTFVVNSYYKLQLRFDKNNDPNISLSSINSDYLSTKRAYFSEWSSVCLLKAIPEITVHFNNFTQELDDYLRKTNTSITNLPSDFVVPVRVPQYIPGLIPFAGNLTFEGFDDAGLNKNANTEYYRRDIKTTSNSEYLMSYRIVVTNQKEVVLRDSGVQYPSKAEKTNNFYWLCDMTMTSVDDSVEQEDEETRINLEDDFTVTLTFTTNNQYTFSKSFNFKLVESLVDNFEPIFNFLNARDLPYYGKIYNDLITNEDGKIQLRITNKTEQIDAGYLFIKRASALDNFQNWQLLDCCFIKSGSNKDFDRTITDNTLSSLTQYKYACQYLTVKGNWSKNEICSETIYPDFHDILISRGNRQLAIRYNAQISSMTPVVNRVKIDTLGGRYPKFAENAKMHYKQFQLSGLIVAESDYNRQFLSELNYAQEMKAYDIHMKETMQGSKYMVRNDTVIESNPAYLDAIDVTSHDLYPSENWWWERKFREEAIEWLNDGEPKLYRSMTEGNLIVMIDSVSLTPNPQLGRRIWNFSATLYEVGDGNSLEELDTLGIYEVANVYDDSLTKILDEDGSGNIPYEEHRYIGQTFSISADNAEQTSTKIVNILKENDRHGFIPIDNKRIIKDEQNNIVETGLSERAWAEAMTLGEKIHFLYEGLNRDFDPTSIKLRDVKIQFESLPQWYDLNALTPEGTNPYAVGLTISVFNNETKEWEEKVGRIYYDANNILRWEPEIERKEPLWAKSGVSITDFINNWEVASGNAYEKIKTGETEDDWSYIGSLATKNYFYGTKAKITDKDYIQENELKKSLYKRNNESNEWELWTNYTESIENIFYKIKKDETEIALNQHYFLQKDLLDEAIYKKQKSDNDNMFDIYDSSGNKITKNNYYTRLNSSLYYMGENNEFYQIKKNYADEYYQNENNNYISKQNLAIYRKAGKDYIIKCISDNNNDNNFKNFKNLDDLTMYTIELPCIENDLNGINIFDDYYNSKIDIEGTISLDLPAENNNLDLSLATTTNQEESTDQEGSANQFDSTIFIKIINEDNNDKSYGITWKDELYQSIQWTKKVSKNGTQINISNCEKEKDNKLYKYEDINIISKNLKKVFKDWQVIAYKYKGQNNDEQNVDESDNIFIDSYIKDSSQTDNWWFGIEYIKVKPYFEEKPILEQKLIFNKESEEKGSLSFSLKYGESITIYNLPDGANYKINNNKINVGENSINGKWENKENNININIKGTISGTSSSIIDSFYVLQLEKNNNNYIDIARTINNKNQINFYNISISDSTNKFRVKRLYDNTIINVILDDNITEGSFNFKNISSNSENKNIIDITKDYILNTNLLDKSDIEYYEIKKEPIQIQNMDGTWSWDSEHKVYKLVQKIDQNEIDNYFIKYNSIYLKVSDIKNYPYFYYDESTEQKFNKIINVDTYYEINNGEYIKIPNIENHYARIHTKENIRKATQQNEEIIPNYIDIINWNNEECWDKYYYYNYQFDPHMTTNCYKDQNQNDEEYWEYWDINSINKEKLYENINNENSIIPTFVEIKDTQKKENKKYFYMVNDDTKMWNKYSDANYYPLISYFEKNDDINNNSLDSLIKYVYVANINEYFSIDNIIPDSQTFGPGNELIKVNLNTGADLESSGKIYDNKEIVNAMKDILDNENRKIDEKNYGLGYKLRLILTSPYNPTINLERTIFVNDRGYYQIPSNMVVKDIGLFDGARATIDYILEYEVKYNDVSEPNAYEVAENIVGQVSGEWEFGTQIAPIIAAKYYAYDKDDDGYITTQQSVDYWRAISYDGVPYTRLTIKSTARDDSNEFIVSRTGVLNLETDYPTEGITIRGKRMIEAPKDRQKFLDEWEYVLDDSVFDDSYEGDEDSGTIHWWIVYPYEDADIEGANIEDWKESDVLVKIVLDESLDIASAKEIADKWYKINEIPTSDNINYKTEIIQPEYNTIYKVLNASGESEYRIYYLNQGWYPIESIDFKKKICNAKVPVSGMINYRANILKKLWINE